MGMFRHAAISFLPDGDYVPLAMPTTDIDLMWLLTQEGRYLHRFGLMQDVLAAPNDLPDKAFRLAQPVANAKGTTSNTKKAGLSIAVTNTILTALGGKAGLDLSATGAASVEYEYTGVTSDAVFDSQLDAWLAEADYAPGAGRSADLLAAEQLYLVVGTLKATGLTVTSKDEHGGALDLQVPTVQELVGGGLTVSTNAGRSSSLTFGGDRPLVIAVKAAQLQLDWRGFGLGAHPAGAQGVRGGLAGGGARYLKADELYLG
jgi:hypothetical protein